MKIKHATLLLLFLMLQTVAFMQLLPQTYQLDTKKSKILWNTGKLMGGHYGYLLFNSGSLQYSTGGNPLNGSFSMDMNSMRSIDNPQEAANQKTDANLRKAEFFAVDKYSSSTINVRKITRINSSNTFKVAGELTIKGITHPIEFIATIITKDNTAHITANVDIHRQLWNIDSEPKTNSLSFLSGIAEKMAPDIHVVLDLILNK